MLRTFLTGIVREFLSFGKDVCMSTYTHLKLLRVLTLR